jgi:hypothetical protein
MLLTQAVNYQMDQAQPIFLNENLFTLREQLGRQSEDLINDDRLSTMLRITKGDISEARYMALAYILHTLKLQAENHEGDQAYNRQLTEHYTAMSSMLPVQRSLPRSNVKVKSRTGLLQFLAKRS